MTAIHLLLIVAHSKLQRPIRTVLVVWSLSLGCWFLGPVSADESWEKTPDGRLVVDLKGIKVGLPILAADDSRNATVSSVQLYFPGPPLDILSVKDLMTKPEESRRHIADSKAIVLVVWGGLSDDWFYDVIGGIVRVGSVGLAFGPDANCISWKRTYREWRNETLTKSADSDGWISQGEGYVRFVDGGHRAESRYYAVNCGPWGNCQMTVCRDGLTTSFNFNGTGKRNGFRQPIDTSRFDDAIKFAVEKLNRLLLEQKADLTYGPDE